MDNNFMGRCKRTQPNTELSIFRFKFFHIFLERRDFCEKCRESDRYNDSTCYVYDNNQVYSDTGERQSD